MAVGSGEGAGAGFSGVEGRRASLGRGGGGGGQRPAAASALSHAAALWRQLKRAAVSHSACLLTPRNAE
jgi:hypothetical protein